MTPQERDLITALLTRLQQHAGQPKDAEADALIRRGMAQQPDAPYLLVQTVLIQDMALANAEERIKNLERQLAAGAPATPQQPSSFLAGAAHGSVPVAGSAPRPAAPVWTQSGGGAPAAPTMAAAPAAMVGGGSGFLRQAAATAAGIAGGALLFQGIQSLFGSHWGGGFLAGMPAQPGLSETVINNYYGDQAPEAREAAGGAGGILNDADQAYADQQDLADADLTDVDLDDSSSVDV
jgi:hypothetical protein